jgi:hypothetical protein
MAEIGYGGCGGRFERKFEGASFSSASGSNFFIMAQKQVMPVGWDPIDPKRSVKVNKTNGQFQSLSKLAVPVPGNVLTQSFLMYAYGIAKETFRRWMGEGSEFRERIPHNKGKSVVDNYEMATSYFTPKKVHNRWGLPAHTKILYTVVHV